MALTQAQLDARAGKLTASSVGVLMSGSDKKIMNLWRELIGDPDYERDDLSSIWPVQLGSVTEELNLDWYERKTGHPILRRGEVVVSPKFPWAAATLDGWDSITGIPIECKHVGGFEPVAVILNRYKPQCHWQMLVTETESLAMSIIFGAKEPAIKTVHREPEYETEIFQRATEFMACVSNLTPPKFIGENA